MTVPTFSNARKSRHEDWRVHLALLGVQVTFGIYPVLAKILMRQMSPSTLASIRILGATAVFHLILAGSSHSRHTISRRDFILLALGGAVGIAVNQLFYIYGVALTTAMNATWISGSIPVFTMVLATLRGQERPRPLNWAGVFMAFSGCLWLVGIPDAGVHDRFFIGSLFLVAGSIVYSFYLVLLRSLLQRLPTVAVVAWTFTFGAPVILAFGWDKRQEWGEISAAGWCGLALVVALPTVIAYLLNNWALGHARPSLVASYINVQPIIVAAGAVAFLHEHLTLKLIVSGVLIFLGVYCASRRAHLVPSPVE